MAKKNKNSTPDDYLKLKSEMLFDKVAETFKTQPENYISELEKIGFKYYEEEDSEEIEERNAAPKNQNQRDLVDFLKGKQPCTDAVLEAYLTECTSEDANGPLIRKYFKKANQNLKALILYGLDRYPGSSYLLPDLAYFHEFENMLGTLITYYTRACVSQENLETFSELAQDFYYATAPDDYDALQALRELFPAGSEKRKIIDILISEEEAAGEEVIKM
jgi:hypothetical protein